MISLQDRNEGPCPCRNQIETSPALHRQIDAEGNVRVELIAAHKIRAAKVSHLYNSCQRKPDEFSAAI